MKTTFLVIAFLAALPVPAASQRLPDTMALRAAAPDSFRVRFTTTKGEFDVMAHRAWSPLGADRLYHLVGHDYFTDLPFYRVVTGFVAQFGMTRSKDINSAWAALPIVDEPVKTSNTRGRMHFARSGANTRSADFAIMLVDNDYLNDVVVGGVPGFPPVAEVVAGMSVVDSLYAGYEEKAGAYFDSIFAQGRSFLSRTFPQMDYVLNARIVTTWPDREVQHGEATYYADRLTGRATSSGVIFDNKSPYAAHRNLPFGTLVRVTNLTNQRSVVLEVVDRGPHGTSERARQTVIDVSRSAAEQLDFVRQGRTRVSVEVLRR